MSKSCCGIPDQFLCSCAEVASLRAALESFAMMQVDDPDTDQGRQLVRVIDRSVDALRGACGVCGHSADDHGRLGCHALNCDCTRFTERERAALAGRGPEARPKMLPMQEAMAEGDYLLAHGKLPDATPSPDVRGLLEAVDAVLKWAGSEEIDALAAKRKEWP